MKMQKSVTFVKKNLKISIWNIRNIVNLEIIVIVQGNIEALHIASVIFHNASNYDYHFIIKGLAE